MPGRIFSRTFTQAILDSSRELRSLSDLHCHSLLGFEPLVTPQLQLQLQLQLPEVRAPSQYLADMGFKPALAQQLSKTYMDFVAQYRKTCQSHFYRAAHGGGHIAEYYREVFVVLFRRTVQAWDSQIVSIVRAQLYQAGAPQTTVRPERMDIRVDDVTKAEIIARLGLKATHLIFDRMGTSPSADVVLRLEKVSQQKHALSTNTTDSHSMLPVLSPISSTEVTSRPLDPFSQPAPPTCFPAPYPPPPEYSLSYSPQRALATSFVPPAPRNMRPSASYNLDVSSLTNLFGRMAVTTLKTNSTSPKCHRMFGVSEPSKIIPVQFPTTTKCSTEPQPASIESIASPPKSTTTARRRKIAALPTRLGKTTAPPSPPVFDSTGTTSYPIPRPSERAVEGTPPDHVPTSPQRSQHVSTLPSLYTADVSCLTTPKSIIARQRRAHTLHHKTLPHSQTIPQNQTLTPLPSAGKTLSYTVSRSPLLVSDATSYFDSPPTSSDELDTPPSTPPSSHVFLARTSTEGFTISSESVGVISHKELLGGAKLPNPRQRYRRLDFTKVGLVGDEQPLTFTFSV